MISRNIFAYTASPRDSLIQTVILGGYRAYMPQIGRFLKQDSDPPFLSCKTQNGFDYAAGNPVVNQDPSGHWSMISTAAAFGASSGLLTGLVGGGGWANVLLDSEDWSSYAAYPLLIGGVMGALSGGITGGVIASSQAPGYVDLSKSTVISMLPISVMHLGVFVGVKIWSQRARALNRGPSLPKRTLAVQPVPETVSDDANFEVVGSTVVDELWRGFSF